MRQNIYLKGMNRIPNVYHILNGDVLKEQFPKMISGEIIVTRECLVEGPVQANNLEELFALRAHFIKAHYKEVSIERYYDHTISQFEQILAIPPGASVYLWFEDDLFCQVNFWFVVYLLSQKGEEIDLYLVRPPHHTPYGFGGLDKTQLFEVYQEAFPLKEIENIGVLWSYYQQNERTKLQQAAQTLAEKYPFILEAVEAHIARLPEADDPGRPVRVLQEIMQELGTQEFGPVFRTFSQREAIYGFGDRQVHRLWKELVADLATD